MNIEQSFIEEQILFTFLVDKREYANFDPAKVFKEPIFLAQISNTTYNYQLIKIYVTLQMI